MRELRQGGQYGVQAVPKLCRTGHTLRPVERTRVLERQAWLRCHTHAMSKCANLLQAKYTCSKLGAVLKLHGKPHAHKNMARGCAPCKQSSLSAVSCCTASMPLTFGAFCTVRCVSSARAANGDISDSCRQPGRQLMARCCSAVQVSRLASDGMVCHRLRKRRARSMGAEARPANDCKASEWCHEQGRMLYRLGTATAIEENLLMRPHAHACKVCSTARHHISRTQQQCA